MSVPKERDYLISLVNELRRLPRETEWVEFKENYADLDGIGEYVSALSNSSALSAKTNGYLIWGINNDTHEVVGTTFRPFQTKKGNEDLES
jgi:ATP-dependent DNA helicase RecG